MKIIVIGDIHGRPTWKEIDPEKYDKIIFDGDYLDSRDPFTDEEIIENFKQIIEFKKTNPDKVVLLIGNHDIMYYDLDDSYYQCSGFRLGYAIEANKLLSENHSLFLAAYEIGVVGKLPYLFTHAGVSTGWYNYNLTTIEKVKEEHSCDTLSEILNAMFQSGIRRRLLGQVGSCRGGWLYNGGIFWADRRETKNDYLIGYHQIVGHTPIDQITQFGDEKGSIRYVDVLWNKDVDKKFYEFEL